MKDSASQKCAAQNRNGEPCGQFAMKDCKFCYVHSFGRFKGIPLIKNATFQFITATILAIALFFLASLDSNQKYKELRRLLNGIADKAGGQTLSHEEEMAYRAIVEKIYGDLEPKASIRFQDKIHSLTNVTSHVVDISIRSVLSGQNILTVVNVYPGLSQVDEQKVLEFAALLTDVGASKGIMVCNSGYTSSAKALAPSLGIELCSIQDAQSKDWSEDIKIPVLVNKTAPHLNGKFNIYLEKGDVYSTNFLEDHFSRDGGKSVTTPFDIFVDLWNKKLISHNSSGVQGFNLADKDWTVWIEGQNKRWAPISDFQLVYSIEDQGWWLKYFTPTKYMAVKDELSGNISISSLDVRLGPFVLDDTWVKISNPDAFKTRTKGALVVLQQVHPHPVSGKTQTKAGEFRMEELNTNNEDLPK
jgi:hypothetical protein